MIHYTVWTDGACSGNPGAGGYGAVIQYESDVYNGLGEILVQEFHPDSTTNNRMEVLAAIAAIEAIGTVPAKITIRSDSSYLVQSAQKMDQWVKRRFVNVKNTDLWVRLYKLIKPHEMEWIWIKRSSEPENELADALASGRINKEDVVSLVELEG